jgi:hypothetical protein
LIHPVDGPLVWTRRHPFVWAGTTVLSVESFFWCPVARFVPNPTGLVDDVERESYLGSRWWTLDELDEPHGELIAPNRIGPLVRALRDRGPAAEPCDAGI